MALFVVRLATAVFLLVVAMPSPVNAEDWKNQIVFPNEPFCAAGISENDPGWVKFIIKLDDPCTVYFQDSQLYVLHYDFATAVLPPFTGMTPEQFNQVTLYEPNQQAALGVVFMPPILGDPPTPAFGEYGIQFVRHDPYAKEEIASMFNVVKTSVLADPNVQAFYFPSYEQCATAEDNRDWFEAQGIAISSTARWAQGNPCYSEGWALGELKFFGADDIEDAYRDGLLEPNDILLTDGVPAEIPFVAGIISLSPSTPSSHVAILAKTYAVPFVYLALVEDANRVQRLVGHRIVFRAYDDGYGAYDVRLIDVEGVLTEQQLEEIRALKAPPDLDISPMVPFGTYSAGADGLLPADINNFGGKASNFGILRTSIASNSPVAVAFSFDLWNEFLDQPVAACNSVTIDPNGYLLFWADNDQEQGPTHTNFKLDNDGEYVGFYDRDGSTLIDGITFGAQSSDVSYGRLPDGNDNWVFFGGGAATPGWSNSGSSGGPGQGVFINEFMAENDSTIEDPDGGGYPDWIELYNAGTTVIDLGGMYLTDDMNDPTMWMIPVGITGNTLREEINNRLSGYSYPPSDMAALSADLSAVRSLFVNANITSFSPQLQDAVIATLQDANYGFDPNQKIRFRSSTNVEDSEQFTGAGLYGSYSGCLADDLDGDDDGPCICDPCRADERGVFRAIRKVFASFYNDNAFLERLRHNVNETQVGMALLVHHSFPDEIELANGVATLEKGSGTRRHIMLVTQLGATSVANPEDGSIPEQVTVTVYSSGGIYPWLVCWSSLVPIGDTVMQWEDDYDDLSELLVAAADRFEQVTGKTEYLLDFEYKKLAAGGAAIPGGGLVVKQIRQIPQPNDTPSITPFLINEPTEYCGFRSESQDIFANHRLKSRWRLETKSLWLDEPNLVDSFYTEAYLEYQDRGRIRSIIGTLPLWPFASHSYDGDANDSWLMHHLANPRTYKLQTTNIPTLVSPAQNPLLTLSDLGHPGLVEAYHGLSLYVNYDQPVPSSWGGGGTTTTDLIELCPCQKPQPDDWLEERAFYDVVNNVNITTSFYWPTICFMQCPLRCFVETIIRGYTTEEIVLRGYYSQTYSESWHNFWDVFIFEPQLEPGISQNILDELRAQDIRLIYFDPLGTIKTYGFEEESFIPGDFEPDGDVDFRDFCLFAERWLDTVCDACGKADLTGDGQVNAHDLLEFTEHWLAETHL
ncbi:MAG: PEP/pyruvate-binding domain-containing protein [Planctomycetota bacterium]